MTEKDMAKQHATENHAAARQPAEQPSGKQMPERQTVKAEAAEEKAMEKETGKKKREAEGNYKRDTVKRVLSYIGAYRLLVLFSLVLAAVTVALTLYIPILIGDAVDLIVGKGQVDFPGLFRIFRVMVVVIASTSAAQWLMNAINNHITYRVAMDIRTRAFNHLESLPLRYIDSHQYGDILSRIITDVDQFSDGLLMGFTQLFSGVLTILGTLAFMFYINPVIALVVVQIGRAHV